MYPGGSNNTWNNYLAENGPVRTAGKLEDSIRDIKADTRWRTAAAAAFTALAIFLPGNMKGLKTGAGTLAVACAAFALSSRRQRNSLMAFRNAHGLHPAPADNARSCPYKIEPPQNA